MPEQSMTEGGTTEVHGMQVPAEYENYKNAYFELLAAADEGVTLVVQAEGDLPSISIDDVFAYVKNEDGFYLSDTSAAGGWKEMTVTANSNTDYLPLAGGTMEGDIDMDGNSINRAGTLDANTVKGDTVEATNEMILPIK